MKAAQFPREKSLRAFDFDANPNIDPAVIHHLATCDWVKKGLPLCLIGDSGTECRWKLDAGACRSPCPRSGASWRPRLCGGDRSSSVVLALATSSLCRPGAERMSPSFGPRSPRWRTNGNASDHVQREILSSLLISYGGELLTEDGPSEWVVGEREQFRADAARASTALAGLELRDNDPVAAQEAAELLRSDRSVSRRGVAAAARGL
ncbi:ATP-binding protein [Kribbella sp. CA-294648]|uniref:ATP-binding protein n=1 Tax=Kribbella sp. CA-294648 TaxID=3239948 RepID=UPI003D914702